MTDYDVAKAVHTHTVDDITNVTDFAQGVLTGSTDAATFRTAIGAGTGSGSSAWGAISGTLSNQTDLQTALTTKYAKPSDGIPKTDFAAAVQTSLGKADTALQSMPSATTSAAGAVALATTAQATTGTDTTHAVTPAGVSAAINASGPGNLLLVTYDTTVDAWPTYNTDPTKIRFFISTMQATVSATPVGYNPADMWFGQSA